MVPGSRLDEAAEPQRALCLGFISEKGDRAKENGAGQSLGRSGGAATRFVPRHHFPKRRQGEGKWCRAVAWTKRRSRNALCASASFFEKTTGRRKMVPGSRLDEAAEPQRALCLGIIFQKGRQGEGKWCRAVAWTKRRSRNALCASASFFKKGDRAKENGAGQSLGRSGGAATRFVPRHHFPERRQGEGKWCRAVAWTKRRSRNALCASASFFKKGDRAKENGAGQSLGRSGGAATRFVPRHHFPKRRQGEDLRIMKKRGPG